MASLSAPPHTTAHRGSRAVEWARWSVCRFDFRGECGEDGRWDKAGCGVGAQGHHIRLRTSADDGASGSLGCRNLSLNSCVWTLISGRVTAVYILTYNQLPTSSMVPLGPSVRSITMGYVRGSRRYIVYATTYPGFALNAIPPRPSSISRLGPNETPLRPSPTTFHEPFVPLTQWIVCHTQSPV